MVATEMQEQATAAAVAAELSADWRTKVDEKDATATIVMLSVNDVYDMYPDENGRGGKSPSQQRHAMTCRC